MTSFLDKLSFAAVFVVMSLMPVMSHAGGLGVAPLVFILGAIGLFLAVKTKAVSITRTQIILTIFLVWLCLTSLWSPYKPDDVLTNYIKLAIMVGIFYWGRVLFEYAARRHQQRLQHLFMATSFFAVGLLVIDLLSNFGLTFLFNPVSNYDEAILCRDEFGSLNYNFTLNSRTRCFVNAGAVAPQTCAACHGVILITFSYCSVAQWISRWFSGAYLCHCCCHCRIFISSYNAPV